MRIYRYALESILGMLDLGDLCPVVAVSHSWAAAVRSMKPIRALIDRDGWRSHWEMKAWRPLPPIGNIVGSPILRHLAAIHIQQTNRIEPNFPTWTPLDNASLLLLAQHAPYLQSLWCWLTLTPNEPLILPAKLRSLHLQIDGAYTDAAVNRVLTTLAALPRLSCLRLELASFDDENFVELDLLATCRSLTDLWISRQPQLSDTQIDQIRSSLGHLHRFDVGRITSDDLQRLLHPPVTARWRDIGPVIGDARTGELLLTLSNSLTKLELCFYGATAPVDFLPQLPRLRMLYLECWNGAAGIMSADAIFASLVQCTSLTELDISCGLNSTQWSALFAKLTSIKKLTIWQGNLETLECFAAGSITQSLEELALASLHLPPFEVSHLYALRRLRTLDLDHCFSSPLAEAALDRISPPTHLLPALTLLFHAWVGPGDDGDGGVDRHGPSFEWMQARLTQ